MSEACDSDMTERRVCASHSGLEVKLTGGLFLLLSIFGMLGYQTFFQVPQLKFDVNQEITVLKAKIIALEKNDTDLLSAVNRIEQSSYDLGADIDAVSKATGKNTAARNKKARPMTFMEWVKGAK